MSNTAVNHNLSKPLRFPHLQDCSSSAEIISMYGGLPNSLRHICYLREQYGASDRASLSSNIYVCVCKCIFMHTEYAYLCVVCIKMKIALPHILSHLGFREYLSGRYFHHNFIYKEANIQGVLKAFQGVQR